MRPVRVRVHDGLGDSDGPGVRDGDPFVRLPEECPAVEAHRCHVVELTMSKKSVQNARV